MVKPKAKHTSRTSQPRPPKARTRPKPAARAKRAAPKKNSLLIDQPIHSPGDWRSETLGRIRKLIHAADPEAIEEVKWKKPSHPSGVTVWSHQGIICTGETYRDKVKLTFARGAALDDPARLFNSSLEGNARRAIDIREQDVLDAQAFKALIRAAVAANLRAGAAKSRSPA